MEIRNNRRRYSKTQGEARLESVPFTNVADLSDICFDKLKSISFDYFAPLSQLFFYVACRCTDPLQLKMENVCRVVNDIFG